MGLVKLGGLQVHAANPETLIFQSLDKVAADEAACPANQSLFHFIRLSPTVCIQSYQSRHDRDNAFRTPETVGRVFGRGDILGRGFPGGFRRDSATIRSFPVIGSHGTIIVHAYRSSL
jgi:hypothetical protein